jgi:hypothetical protein
MHYSLYVVPSELINGRGASRYEKIAIDNEMRCCGDSSSFVGAGSVIAFMRSPLQTGETRDGDSQRNESGKNRKCEEHLVRSKGKTGKKDRR